MERWNDGRTSLTRSPRLGNSRGVTHPIRPDPNRPRLPDEPAAPAEAAAPDLVLASASPRRREILAEAGLRFEILPAEIDETADPGESPADLVERLAREKALEVARRLPARPGRLVLGSDTIVVAPDGEVLGKPRDAEHAVEQLSRLVGRWHHVMTAIAIAHSGGGDLRSQIVLTRVRMRPANRDELVAYVAVGESFDKAGGYAIQGEGRRFVVGIEGSRSNVIGLPLEETLALLATGGIARPAEANRAETGGPGGPSPDAAGSDSR